MCGLAGLWEPGPRGRLELVEQVQGMAERLVHRGPDDGGVWVDSEVGVGLGSRRLAIIDLSPEGHQPMCSESGRYVMAFNGEVYNFATLRQELESLGHGFRGHSDTEVMLAAIEQWGLQSAVGRFVGMFAFALWDRQQRCLSLVRDRLGIKPLYYGWMGSAFLFGSELKALRAYSGFHAVVDRGSLTLYLRLGYVPYPYSIYQGIFQLPPGCLMTLAAPAERPTPVPYWSLRATAERGVEDRYTGSVEEAVEQLECLLREAVKLRLVADVPLGAFLSGGIDSSTVVALMQTQSERPVKTFTIGFEEDGYDEARHARAVADHLGTNHSELYVTPSEVQRIIPLLPEMYDEPFWDPAQIPTFLISRLARSEVTVSLSGDGGDEVFGGYTTYTSAKRVWRKMQWLPAWSRRTAALAAARAGTDAPDNWFGSLARTPLGKRVRYLAEVLGATDSDELFYLVASRWKRPAQVVVGGTELPTVFTDRSNWPALSDFTERMMYLDSVCFLPNEMLAKVDRASMAVSLEARVPLLDHRVVEYAWHLPLSLKIRDGQGKWLLRQLLYRFVPRDLIDRPKKGFSVPIGDWLRGPLREWAEELLEEGRLRQEGFLQPDLICQRWSEHVSGQRDRHEELWTVLMFQAWLARWG